MPSEAVRVKPQTRDLLDRMSAETGLSLSALVAEAVEHYRRQLFLKMANESYASLRRDENAWREHKAEQREWDATLSDGLDGV